MPNIVTPTVSQIGLNNKLIQFAKESNKPHGESFSLLSALVNLVDTARENPDQFSWDGDAPSVKRMTQEEREEVIARFILAHRS